MNIQTIIRMMAFGAGLRAFYFIVTIVVAFYMMPFLVHSLGMRDYGIWSLVMIVVGYYSFLDIGLASAVGRFVSRAIGSNDFDEVNVVISTSFLFFLAIGVIIVILIISSSFFIDQFFETTRDGELFKQLFLILGLSLGIELPFRAYSGVLGTYLRYDLLTYRDLVTLVLRSLGTVYLIHAGYGLVALAFLTMSLEVLSCTLFYVFAKHQLPSIRVKVSLFSKARLKELYRYGAVSFVGILANVTKIQIIPVAVSFLHGLEMVTMYSVAVRMMVYFHTAVRSATMLTSSLFSRLEGSQDWSRIIEMFKQSTFFTSIACVFIASIIFIHNELFISLWLGDGFNQTSSIINILVFAFLLLLVQLPFDDLCLGTSNHRYIARLNVITVLLIGIGIAVLNYIYPTQETVAYAFLIATVIVELTKPYIVSKYILKQSVVSLYGENIKRLCALLVVPVYYYLIVEHLEIDSYLSLLASCAIHITVYLATLLVIVPKQTTQLIISSIGVRR